MTEGTYRTKASASSEPSGVYIGPLIRHCLIGKRGPRVQALRVPHSHGYSPPPPDSPITSCHCYTSGGDCYTPGGDYYCAQGCRLFSSILLCSAYPQQVQQPLPQCLQPFKGPTSSFERLQQRAKLSRMLAGGITLTLKPLQQADNPVVGVLVQIWTPKRGSKTGSQ